MSSFMDDFEAAEKLANKKKASASRPTVRMPDLPMKSGVRPVHVADIIPRSENFNHLKKVHQPAPSYRKSIVKRLLGLQ